MLALCPDLFISLLFSLTATITGQWLLLWSCQWQLSRRICPRYISNVRISIMLIHWVSLMLELIAQFFLLMQRSNKTLFNGWIWCLSFSVCVFQSTVERLVKDKMPKKSGGWWFSWRRRDIDSSSVQSLVTHPVTMLYHYQKKSAPKCFP